MRRLILFVTIALALSPQTGGGIATLTPERLAQAIEDGKAKGEEIQLDASPMNIRMRHLDVRNHLRESKVILQRIADAPFSFYVRSPYIAAALLAAHAARKYEPVPALDASALNDAKVVVHVQPGDTFSTVDTIENVVIQRDGVVIQPLSKTVERHPVQNKMGASRDSAVGDFTFDFAAFAPTGPITFVLIGSGGNFEWTMTADELAQLK